MRRREVRRASRFKGLYVKAPHLATLTTKAFFGESQNNPSPVFRSRGSCTSVKPHDITRELLLLLGKGIVSIGHT